MTYKKERHSLLWCGEEYDIGWPSLPEQSDCFTRGLINSKYVANLLLFVRAWFHVSSTEIPRPTAIIYTISNIIHGWIVLFFSNGQVDSIISVHSLKLQGLQTTCQNHLIDWYLILSVSIIRAFSFPKSFECHESMLAPLKRGNFLPKNCLAISIRHYWYVCLCVGFFLFIPLVLLHDISIMWKDSIG